MKTRLLWLVLLGFSVLIPSSQAKVAVDPKFEGTVVITLPNGEIRLIETGDAVPEIPPQSVIEVFDGKFDLTTEKGDQTQVACLDHTFNVEDESKVSCSCHEQEGSFTAVKGAVKGADPESKPLNVEEGSTYPIKLKTPQKNQPAAATAEGEPTGGNPPGGDISSPPPVDSRSIDSSPSQ